MGDPDVGNRHGLVVPERELRTVVQCVPELDLHVLGVVDDLPDHLGSAAGSENEERGDQQRGETTHFPQTSGWPPEGYSRSLRSCPVISIRPASAGSSPWNRTA